MLCCRPAAAPMLGACAFATILPMLLAPCAAAPRAAALTNAQGRRVSLPTLRGRKRVALLFVPARLAPPAAAFLRAAREQQAQLRARDLAVFVVAPPHAAQMQPSVPPGFTLLSDTQGRAARAYGAPPNTAWFVLLGKDGGVKIAQKNPPSLRALFGTIDAMPMRREERRRRGR